MSFAPHLTLVTDLLPIIRRDFPLADTSILNPNATNPLLDGEWLQLNSSYQLTRGAAGDVVVPTWQVFSERGRYDTQAIGKVPVLFLGGYEAETDIADFTGLAVGDKLMVSDVTIGGQVKKGLKKTTATGKVVVAWVTRLIGSGADQKVRYYRPGTPIVLP